MNKLITGSLSLLFINSSFFFNSQAKEEFIAIEAVNFQLKSTKIINLEANGSFISISNSNSSQIEDLLLVNSQISDKLIDIKNSLAVTISSVSVHFNVLTSIISLSNVVSASITLVSSTSNLLLSFHLFFSESFLLSLTNSTFFNISSSLVLLSSLPIISSSFNLTSIIMEEFTLSPSTPPPFSILTFQLTSCSTLILSDFKIYSINDASLGNSHLISIMAPESAVILESFWVKNCRFMLSLFEITGKTIIFSDSILANNQNLGLSYCIILFTPFFYFLTLFSIIFFCFSVLTS